MMFFLSQIDDYENEQDRIVVKQVRFVDAYACLQNMSQYSNKK